MVKWKRIFPFGKLIKDNLEEEGEEVIRAQMELEKIRINAGVAMLFSFMIAYVIFLAEYNLPPHYYLIIYLFVSSTVIVGAYFFWIQPAVGLLKDLAVELDNRKKKL